VEILFSPWRHAYVTSAKDEGGRCILCRISESQRDEENLVLHRTASSFALVNRFPYNSGHLMVVPFRHASGLVDLTALERADLVEVAAGAEGILRDVYGAQGINLGINLGASAGAGIDGHLHLHLVPRWTGDTNFMSVVGETRVLPEGVGETWSRLAPFFAKGPGR
jgi:ATP adenylyltransferase